MLLPCETIVIGSLVVIDGCVVHWSDRNISANSRHAYTVHVYDGTSEWSERNWLASFAHFSVPAIRHPYDRHTAR